MLSIVILQCYHFLEAGMERQDHISRQNLGKGNYLTCLYRMKSLWSASPGIDITLENKSSRTLMPHISFFIDVSRLLTIFGIKGYFSLLYCCILCWSSLNRHQLILKRELSSLTCFLWLLFEVNSTMKIWFFMTCLADLSGTIILSVFMLYL